MGKIKFCDFEKMMMYDIIKNESCIEISFSVENDLQYDLCWLGKTVDKENGKEVYWYGLSEDGSQAYDFSSLKEFVNAKVFKGKSIKEIWGFIVLRTVNGCSIDK